MRATGQIVFHFDPEDPNMYKDIPGYLADIENTGFYGFPAHPSDNRVKIGHHGEGIPMESLSNEFIMQTHNQHIATEEKRWRKFMYTWFPNLANRPIIDSRLCMYCDTFDGDFLIDYDPDITNFLIAAGGSGHGWKFTPVIGNIIADIVEGKPNELSQKFRWRKNEDGAIEQSRFKDVYLGEPSL
eukprot:TRINITY_DN3151_c0_g1_i2.p1 TRINITY_DN3151_c0_g1~~TRINITY_DN3151_c0_g1_i2.p1  ORF type:complete len:185 (+),score=49.77 TRINITY_DN3151_c0_g1_i2:364-918(+)